MQAFVPALFRARVARAPCRSPRRARASPRAAAGGARIAELEEQLDRAVERERYGAAAALFDELEGARAGHVAALLAANLGLYAAMNARSVDSIAAVWSRAGVRVTCVHPLTSMHVGVDSVLESYRVLFATLPADLRVEVSDVRIASFGDVAYVTCLETPMSAGLSKLARGRRRHHQLLALSIFERVPADGQEGADMWALVHHVSNPVLKHVHVL